MHCTPTVHLTFPFQNADAAEEHPAGAVGAGPAGEEDSSQEGVRGAVFVVDEVETAVVGVGEVGSIGDGAAAAEAGSEREEVVEGVVTEMRDGGCGLRERQAGRSVASRRRIVYNLLSTPSIHNRRWMQLFGARSLYCSAVLLRIYFSM